MPSAERPVQADGYDFARMNVAVYLAVTGAVLLTIMSMTKGHFSYSLDDPYIHLALAERLRQGLYGLNAGEPVSPSSSLLWPFLLVPFVGTRILPWAPLLLNVLFSTTTAWLLGLFVQRTFVPDWRGRVLSVLLLAATNVVGLAFTGLEHPLEVLLCVAGAWAVLAVLDDRKVPVWTIAAVALLPSVRYEGIVVTLAVAIALWVARSRWTAVALLAVSLLPLAGFSFFLHHLGLPWFPISVLVKSSIKFDEHRGFLYRLAQLLFSTGKQTLQVPERVPQFLLVVVLGWFAARASSNRRVQFVLAGCALMGAVQVMLGPVGWFYRYEIYCLTFMLIIALHAMRPGLAGRASEVSPRSEVPARLEQSGRSSERIFVPGMLLVLIGSLGMFYATAVVSTARAATSIWQQEAQLGRFASEFYHAPVAVNDLGWVAFNRTRQEYVLDLAGLGSQEVFKTKESKRTAAWLDGITREHGVSLVMIYPSWFKQLVGTWDPVAKLCTEGSRGQLGPAESRVMFYATPLADKAALMEELSRFRATLPQGSVLDLRPADASESCAASTQ